MSLSFGCLTLAIAQQYCTASRWSVTTHVRESSISPRFTGHNTTGQFDPAWHGNGPLRTSLPGFPAVIDPLVIQTTQVLSDEFPFNLDINSGNPLGIGWTQSTIANGTRQSSAVAYLGPVLFRSNLDVLINTQVTRLIQTGRVGGKPIFVASSSLRMRSPDASTLLPPRGHFVIGRRWDASTPDVERNWNHSIWEQFEDPSSGPHAPHYEIAFGVRGYVRLNTSNPFDQPLIDPAFLSTDYDVAVMVEAVRASQRYIAASPWKDYIIRPFIDSANTTTVEGIIEYSRQRTATTRHPTGTAQVGKVVNGDLTIKNISGLRVVDASIFVSPRPLLSGHNQSEANLQPFVPTGHTQAPTYIIAERAADIIKAAHRN
ncbi:ATP-dependent RNA helicase [Salix suchowensis]|nr:ATP-dependent RNA helicase [Salix suchowensis]